ncbi:16S rRNA (cytidine(1402)-2'-O)-methyltransferase [Thermus thermamylovorans]|uniref:Ribosomal RNA small subunit methyltransferase I n=1 Tax=Thermus thermamylovorans TaxID=2509362 RepID=A0A4Q9B5R3_9DEIN|nr:16S rRNA (cytidine(1402)-2'-O)-methyltransferase [Thermus thermamylovorans]TBH21242.1 16S rRNA (cytidine(1402)-2'-O)-methyltransferase [Thermus thermamylovorans]
MRLVLVPTPIGNLEDITLRALRTLREAEVVACEDTRRTGFLLRHYGIPTPTLRLDGHTVGQARELLSPYAYVAYATDAGTPGISDPGAELVRLALEWGWRVEALPGPTALIPALVASGLPTHRFTFEGFLPKAGGERQRRLLALAREGRTAVLYESPHRLRKTLEDLIGVYGPAHPVAVAREISKVHEEVFRGSLKEAWERFAEPRGEFVLVLGPKEAPPPEVEGLLAGLRAQGLAGKALFRALVARGVPRNEAYRLALEEE